MKTSKLKDVSVVITKGTTPSTLGADFQVDGINFIKSESICNSKFLDRTLFSFIDSETDNKLRRSRIKANDLLFSIAGAYLGKLSIVTEADVPANTNQAVGIVRIDENLADVNYLYYYFSQKTVNKYINDLSSQSSQPNLNLDLLGKLEFTNREIEHQKKIAAVLSSLDDKIELNNRINAELEAMAKIIYDYWFVQFDFPISKEQAKFIGKPELEGRPYKTSGGKMVWNEVLKREIPEGWEVKNLFKVCDVQYGYPFSTDFFNNDKLGNPIIRIRDIIENSISNYSTQNNIDEKYIIKIGDVLIGMDGNFHINYWSKENCYLNQRVVKLSKTILPSIYLKYQVEPFIQAREKSVSRTTVGHLSDKDLKAINVIVPHSIILNRINELFDGPLNKILTNKKQNQELASLRDWLLPMLMNGQVTVADAEQTVKKVTEKTQTAKQKNDSYTKIQMLYTTVWANKEIEVKQGEMATAKDVYLLDRIYGIETGFQFKQHNWGSFDPEEKKLLNTKQYFHKPNFPNSKAFYLDLKDDGKLLDKIPADLKEQVSQGVREMDTKVFNRYFGTQKAEKKELFATVLKCIEDRQSLDLAVIREEMANWKIKQGKIESTKAEKFSEIETREALEIIKTENWHRNVMR
ncbi:MAG TPA: restriction endonuclease subunit S [Fluviicola sp.]|nr:restriction endonuclease subunit S [Fluviicola sp.]